MIPVDLTDADGESTSHQRAADAVTHDQALIEQTEHDEYLVLLPENSEGSHRVQYRRSRFCGHDRVASCDCAHHDHRGQHTGQPCAHILAVAMADDHGRQTARGQSIRPYCPPTVADADDEEHELTDDQLATADANALGEAIADGGRDRLEHTAGADGETFGSPEGAL